MSTLRIAFLHLAPCLRDLQANRRLIDRAVTTAATSGATWILTLSGAEGWSSPGAAVTSIAVPPVGQIGLLICADAYTPTPGLRLFDALTDRELTTTPLNVGRLPLTWTLFIE